MEGLENFEDISRSLQSITLAEMDSVALMNRTDTKFMLDRGSALDMLGEIAHGFRILEVNSVRLNRYETSTTTPKTCVSFACTSTAS